MRAIRSMLNFLVVGSIVVGVTQSDAQAKKEKDSSNSVALVEIVETGTSADSVFMPAKEINDTLNSIQTNLQSGNDSLTSTLGLTQGTPLADALADLKTKAGDKLKVAMNGSKPTLSLADDAPDNVKAAVDSANQFVQIHVDAIEQAQGLVPQAQQVATAAGSLNPTDLVKEVATNPMQIPKITKDISSDIKAVTQTPQRIQNIVDTLTTDLSAFAALGQ